VYSDAHDHSYKLPMGNNMEHIRSREVVTLNDSSVLSATARSTGQGAPLMYVSPGDIFRVSFD